jgi:hypothetical protein
MPRFEHSSFSVVPTALSRLPQTTGAESPPAKTSINGISPIIFPIRLLPSPMTAEKCRSQKYIFSLKDRYVRETWKHSVLRHESKTDDAATLIATITCLIAVRKSDVNGSNTRQCTQGGLYGIRVCIKSNRMRRMLPKAKGELSCICITLNELNFV